MNEGEQERKFQEVTDPFGNKFEIETEGDNDEVKYIHHGETEL